MSPEDFAKKVGLFYFYSFLNDQQAAKATVYTVKKLRSVWKKNQKVSSEELVSATFLGWCKFKKQSILVNFNKSNWTVPGNRTLSPWKEFYQNSSEDEFLMIIWSKILCISDESISTGMGLTRGTVRYRISKGLNLLGCACDGIRANV